MAAVAFVGIAAFPFLPVASLPQIEFPPILVLMAHYETLPLTTVQVNADNFLIPAITQVPGVAGVLISGERHPSIRIQVDPAKLAASGLTLEEIRTTIVNATTNTAKGT